MVKTAPIYDRTMHEARTYWRDRRHEMSFAAQIPLDHPRPRDGQRDLATLERGLDRAVDGLLERLTGGKPALVYTALVSGLRICCYKYTGRPEVTLLSASRRVEDGVANLVPIAGAVDRRASFKDTLLATRELLAGGFKNQNYPFPRMLLDLGKDQRPEDLSLVVSMTGFSDEVADAACDIALRFGRTAGLTTARLRFDRRIYDTATIARFFECFNAILRRGLAEMATPITELDPDWDDGAEGAARVEDTTVRGASSSPGNASVHELIEARAKEHPERAAIVDRDRVTTYEALVTDADRIADALADLAIDRRKPVGILIDAGAEMVVSMLAVMKAGMAFAPIKALAAGDGLGETLRTLGCESILCKRELLSDLDKIDGSLGNAAHAVTVDYTALDGEGVALLKVTRAAIAGGVVQGDPGERDAGERTETGPGREIAAVLVHPGGDGLALSAVSDAALTRLVGWLNSRFGIGPADRCLLSPFRDSSEQLYDTLGMLAGGASVEIADPSDVQNQTGLADRLLAEAITVWDLPTGLAQNLMAEIHARRDQRADLAGPRAILLSGEKQYPSLADQLRRCFPAAQILGLYASPAVGIWTTHFALDADAAGAVADGAVGQPIAYCVPGFTHRVVNALGEAAPPHAVGNLLLSGPEPNRELVDTGLRAAGLGGKRLRWLRAEDHVLDKRGCWIELTDIEAELCRYEHVHAAEVTVVSAGRRGVDCEVAAFVIADQDQVTVEKVRDLLVQSDAVDLIPDRVVLLDEFPLAIDGAIDRDALIARLLAPGTSDGGRCGVENEQVQKRLRPIWLDALQRDEVDDDDNFFAMGGNSLKATILIARIRDEFGVDLSVQDFFREPSIGGVGQVIVVKSSSAAEQKERPGLRPTSRERYRVRAK